MNGTNFLYGVSIDHTKTNSYDISVLKTENTEGEEYKLYFNGNFIVSADNIDDVYMFVDCINAIIELI